MKILDCTLRDGGYYTQWDFEWNHVATYLDSLNDLPIDYIEVGYRSKKLEGYFGEYFYCPIYVLEKLKARTSKKLVIILNEKDTEAKDVKELLQPCIGLVTMVRIAIDPKNFKRALGLATEVKKLGFEVGFNVMYMSKWDQEKEFLSLIQEVNGVCDYFYMVDSYGGVFPNDVRNIYNLVKERANVPIGFHGHNNLELALINTLTAIEEGVDMVDCTITGMGRGAGNLKTELLLTVLNSQGKADFPYNSLSKVVDTFKTLQNKYGWGTNLPYMVSGTNSLPQKEVMDWVGKRYYSLNSIIRALDNQSKGVKDNIQLPKLNFKDMNQFKQALIIGGGTNAITHSEAIYKFIEKHPNMVVIHASSKNAMAYSQTENKQFFCLVGNEGHRLEEVFKGENIKGECILPAYPRAMGTYIPKALKDKTYELDEVNFTDKYQDSHTALAIQAVLELGIKQVFLTGYDGYSSHEISEKEHDLFLENQYMFELAKEQGLKLASLTPTKYSKLNSDSIYSLI